VNLVAVIEQLRTYAPVFNSNVAGAAAYANAVETQAWLPMPAAYVVPTEDDAGPNTSMTGDWHVVTERFAVIVALDNAADPTDRRGQLAVAGLDAVRASIRKAIVNWRPDFRPGAVPPDWGNAARGIYEIQGSRLDMNRARLIWQFDFGIEVTVTEADCWQPTGPDLTDIRATVVDIETGGTLAVADLPLA
jgi:hypothetical protein